MKLTFSKLFSNQTIVLMLCVSTLIYCLFEKRGLINLWSLHKNKQELQISIENITNKNIEIDKNVEKMKDLSYLRRRAETELGLVHRNDKVVVFGSESEIEAQPTKEAHGNR